MFATSAARLTLLVVTGIAFPKCAWSEEAADSSWTPYRAPDQVILVQPAEVETIYTAALRFYQTPAGHARWLDRRLLPAAPNAPASRMLDSTLATRLVSALGSGFQLLDAKDAGGNLQGVQLRVSEIQALAPDRVRVVVAGLRVHGSGTIDIGSQAFLLAHSTHGWRITYRRAITRGP
jgi:hypothetical protein